MPSNITFRQATPDDVGFLTVTFLKSLADISAYGDGTRPEVMAFLARSLFTWAETTIAIEADEPTVILGWLSYNSPSEVGWIFVRPELRRKGVASALVKHAGLQLSAPILTPFAPTRLKWLTSRLQLRFRPWMLL